MTTLVVQAHPLESSFSAALRQRVVELLDSHRRPFECFRLAEGERPDLDDLAEATELIIVYPTWSGGLPAMLLDWIHDVLDEPSALAEVMKLRAVTSCGSSKWVNLLQGEWGRRYLKTTLLGHCHPSARFDWVPLYKIDRRTHEETTAHLDRLGPALGLAAPRVSTTSGR